MPTNYPSALDDGTSLPTKNAGDTVTSAETNAQSGATKAIEAKLGIGSSTPVKAYELGSTATGSTDWRVRAVIDARDYGAYPGSGSDEAGHLQAAIDACAALGGGIVRLLPGEYLTGTALLITTSGLMLEGAGMEATTLKRTGATTNAVVYIRTPDGTATKILGAGCRRMTINGNSTALYGVRVTTANLVELQQLKVYGCETWQIYTDCWDNAAGGDARDNQGMAFRDIYLTCSGSRGGIKLDGNSVPDANTSLNYFSNFTITIVNGNGFVFGNSDGNTLDFVRVYSSGSGVGIVFSASATASGHARNNVVYGAQPSSAGITANSNTTPSGPNWVHLVTGNGGVPSTVTVSGSAVLYYITDTGVIYPSLVIPEISGVSTPDSGYSTIYAGTDSRLKYKDDGGNTGLIGESGNEPFALPIGLPVDVTSDSQLALIAVTAGNGGMVLIPFRVVGRLEPQSYTIRQASTASLRTAEARLYRDNGDSTIDSVSGSDATFSFTPSAADNRDSSALSGSPILLPGIYWLAIRNTSTSQTFSIRRFSTGVGEFRTAASSLAWNTVGVAALGSTIDITTVESKVAANLMLARINGKAGGAAW